MRRTWTSDKPSSATTCSSGIPVASKLRAACTSWAWACSFEWLENPTAEVAHNAYMWAVGECWDGGVRYFDYPEYFLFPVWALEEELDAAAQYAIRAAPESDRDAAVDWQIAAVRVIAQGQAPSLESLEVHPE